MLQLSNEVKCLCFSVLFLIVGMKKVSDEFLSLPKTSLCYCYIVSQYVVFTVFLLCSDIDTYCELVVRCMLVCM